jgi:hypothetical protein
MENDNSAAYTALKKANDEFRTAIGVIAQSPLPSETWNNIGRSMELQARALDQIQPK